MSINGQQDIGNIIVLASALAGLVGLPGCSSSSDASGDSNETSGTPAAADAGGAVVAPDPGAVPAGPVADAGGHTGMGTGARVLAAYGGDTVWKNATTVKTTATVGGVLFQQKGMAVPAHATFTIDVHQPHVVITPVDAAGNTGILDGFAVTIQSPSGAVVSHRDDARTSLQNATISTQWDELNLLYFVGYAMWGYNALPALLTRPDVHVTEIQDGVLQADFGTTLPVHSQIQRYWFDAQTNLLTRNDYSPTAAAVGVNVANLVLAHGTSAGIPYPSTRRVQVTPKQYGTPEASTNYITIDVDSWELR